jgi:hypothetical protein
MLEVALVENQLRLEIVGHVHAPCDTLQIKNITAANFLVFANISLISLRGDSSTSTTDLELQKAMSSISIATLPRMGRDALAALLLSASEPSNLAIIDVRDSGT